MRLPFISAAQDRGLKSDFYTLQARVKLYKRSNTHRGFPDSVNKHFQISEISLLSLAISWRSSFLWSFRFLRIS